MNSLISPWVRRGQAWEARNVIFGVCFASGYVPLAPSMSSEIQSVPVPLGSRAYRVLIGAGILSQLGQMASELGPELGKRCAVVTDSNVAPLYSERVLASLAAAGYLPTLITVPAGEASKSLPVVERVCDEMIAAGLDRKAWVVALGGGVVGDLAGFVAAIYYRGVPFVQIPTTVIAQVDSAVGGKTGVNAAHGKNLIGAFHQPRLVLADVTTLQTLPPREFNEGVAEIVKHAAIRDRSLLEALCVPKLQFEAAAMAEVIRRNVEIKAAIVAEDEHETKGLRALLNFGHTVGHGIENAAGPRAGRSVPPFGAQSGARPGGKPAPPGCARPVPTAAAVAGRHFHGIAHGRAAQGQEICPGPGPVCPLSPAGRGVRLCGRDAGGNPSRRRSLAVGSRLFAVNSGF